MKTTGTLFLGAVLAFGAVGCAETYTTAPVYRGSYYAYDAYPYGYNGYPGYPYYGAPFGGGASAVGVERSGYRRGDVREARPYRRDRLHSRRTQRAGRTNRTTTDQAREEAAPILQR